MRRLLFALLPIAQIMQAAPYTASKAVDHGVEVVHLADAANAVEVSIAPSVGNMAYEMKVHGVNVLWFPYGNVAEFKARPAFCGVPFLAPWANRLDEYAFWANGRKYLLNRDLGNVRGDQNGNPIHGVLSYSPLWRVTAVHSDAHSASVTSRLDFWTHPELMAQWPFAHEYEMTYKLSGGALEVITTVTNRSTEPMPLSIGYHPYFQLPGVPRDEWMAHLGARKSVEMDNKLIATGEFKPLADDPSKWPNPLPVKSHALDNGFVDLVRGADGKAEFSVEGGGKKISVIYGPKYTVAVAYAPPGKDFICFEPMTAVTNGINLNHVGKYPELQSVPAGGQWRESFVIKPGGF